MATPIVIPVIIPVVVGTPVLAVAIWQLIMVVLLIPWTIWMFCRDFEEGVSLPILTYLLVMVVMGFVCHWWTAFL